MITQDYAPVEPDARMEDDCRQLVRLAVREDLERQIDWTTVAMISPERQDQCRIVSREHGVCCGMAILPWILDELDVDITTKSEVSDGDPLAAGQTLVTLIGNSRDLLTAERTILNFLCRLCGIASLAQRYVVELKGTKARLYDTRKTTPGWRRLEKYAARCGGAHNHRTGLFDGFLIKDNHLALAGEHQQPLSAGDAVRRVKGWRGGIAEGLAAPSMVELEVDSLAQLRDALPQHPDIILLDNFKLPELVQAVKMRDELNPQVELEASGGVRIETVGAIARTGVDRISCGALTHSAKWLDLGMDW